MQNRVSRERRRMSTGTLRARLCWWSGFVFIQGALVALFYYRPAGLMGWLLFSPLMLADMYYLSQIVEAWFERRQVRK